MVPSQTEAAKLVRDWIVAEVLFGSGELQVDDNLLEDGLLDSITIIRLIAFAERRFQIRVPASRITTDHFRSANEIARLLLECERS